MITFIEKSEKEKPNKFVETTPKWKLEDVVLPLSLRSRIEDICFFISNYDTIKKEYSLNPKDYSGCLCINFYGKSGTGKTITAEAVCEKTNRKMLFIDYSQIESSLMGETMKNLKTAFEEAEKMGNILFFDEADALVSKRIANVSHGSEASTNQTKSFLLTLLDKHQVPVIFGTNHFQNYDPAFFRRLLFNVEFQLPTLEQRTKILLPLLSKKIQFGTGFTLEKIAILTDGFSGGLLKNLSLALIIAHATNRYKVLTEEVVAQKIEAIRKAQNDSELKINDSTEKETE